MDKHYHVGQVIFVGSNKKNQVIPVQVTERVTRETVDGRAIVYSVVTPKHLDRPIDLSKVDGQIFTSLEEARRKMISSAERASQDFLTRAKQEINRMVGVAASAAKRFPGQEEKEPKVEFDEPQDDLNIDITDDVYDIERRDEPPGRAAYDQQAEEENDVIMVPGPDGTEIPAKVKSVRVTAKQE